MQTQAYGQGKLDLHGDSAGQALPVARVAVVIATVGRPALAARLVDYLAGQSLPPDTVVVVGSQASDVEGVGDGSALPCLVLLSEKGLTKQRNVGLDTVVDKHDFVIFFDDDFVPSPNFIEKCVGVFEGDPAITGLTGETIADGIHNAGYDFDTAIRLIAEDVPPSEDKWIRRRGLYGCNMAFRCSAIGAMRFDEALPLYGWQEDVDFGTRLARRGVNMWTNRCRGVHLGVKGGRTSGIKLGYSQVANTAYLLRKRSIPVRHAYTVLLKNLISNFVRMFAPEPHIDRAGRAKGNAIAIVDLFMGRDHPERISEL